MPLSADIMLHPLPEHEAEPSGTSLASAYAGRIERWQKSGLRTTNFQNVSCGEQTRDKPITSKRAMHTAAVGRG